MNCPHCSSDQHSVNVTCANCGVIYKALPNWTGLTDEEMKAVVDAQPLVSNINVYFKAIEAKLKEKNT